MDSAAELKVLPFTKKQSEEDAVEQAPAATDPITRAQNLLDNTPGLERPNLGAPRRFVIDIAVDDIALSPFQTRETPKDEDLSELRASILAHGVLQPILVRELPLDDERDTSYELIAGERRLRASILAGLERIPALVHSFSDQESLEVSIIENAQRQNLNPIEEAEAYKLLIDRFHMNHGDIAKTVGKNRSSVSNSLRLLQLEPEVVDLLRAEELSAGHGRALLGIDDPRRQIRLAWKAVHKGFSVRRLEEIVRRISEHSENTEEPSKQDQKESQSLRRIESRVCETLGIEKARLRLTPDGQRNLTLHFPTEAAWRRFMSRLR